MISDTRDGAAFHLNDHPDALGIFIYPRNGQYFWQVSSVLPPVWGTCETLNEAKSQAITALRFLLTEWLNTVNLIYESLDN